MSRQLTKLNTKTTLFMLCDIQEKFRPAMQYFDPMVKNANRLIVAGKALDIPLIATEQYPEGLGKIVKDLDISHACGVYPKTMFTMVIPPIEKKIKEIFENDLKDVVLFGIETHVCVEQTTIDLLQCGYNVHVVADCSMSRLLQERDLALERIRQMGGFITTCENVIFSLLQDKNHPKFNSVRKLFIETSCDVGINTAAKL